MMQNIDRFARMSEPMPEEYEHSLILQAHEARENLAEASRATDLAGSSPENFDMHWTRSVELTKSAIAMLKSCRLMTDKMEVDEANISNHHDRASAAAQASLSLAGVMKSYGSAESAFEKKQRDRSYRHWQMASETARKEAHRLLAALAMRFPNAYNVEDE